MNSTPTIHAFVIPHDELKNSTHPRIIELLEDLAKAFPVKQSLELTAYITLTANPKKGLSTPFIEITADLDINDHPVMAGFMPVVFAALPKLATISAGAFMAEDEEGVYPFVFSTRSDLIALTIPGLWETEQDPTLSALTGMSLEQLEPLFLVAPEARLKEPRRMYPTLQQQWTNAPREAVAGVVLL